PLRDRLGCEDAEALWAERQRPGSKARDAAVVQGARLRLHPDEGPAVVVGPRVRGRLGRVATEVRPARVQGTAGAGCPVRGERGVAVPEVMAGHWRSVEKMKDGGIRETFLIGGRRSPRAGEVFKNPALARSLRLIADGGRDAYYKGDIAAKLVALSDKVGGL